MSGIVAGIDLGTTNCCVSYYYKEKLKILENNEGGRITPSYLFLADNQKLVAGHYAKIMADSKPDRGIYEIKRLIGRQFNDPYLQKNLQYFSFRVEDDLNNPVVVFEIQNNIIKKTVIELYSAILAKIKKDIMAKLGEELQKVVITVPAYFNVTQREVTIAAAEKAGFTVLKLFSEPTAAALSYYFEHKTEEQHYSLVYDLGGGTFDVAILKRNSSSIDIIAVDGDSHLGGNDFDNIITDYVCNELNEKYNYDPKNDRRTIRRIRNKSEEAKKILSIFEETVISLEGVVKNYDLVTISITRKQFESMAENLFRRTISILHLCLSTSNKAKSDIKEVILSGGSTRIPKIQELLSDYFEKRKLTKFVNPDECVAEGAALQAAMLSNDSNQKLKEIKITDVVSSSLGIMDYVGRMEHIVRRNTPIPTKASCSQFNYFHNQAFVVFEIYEGEFFNAKKNHYLGEFKLLNLTPAPPCQCEIILTMNVDQNGILTVTAKEKHRNNVKDLKIAYAPGFKFTNEIQNYANDEKFKIFVAYKEYVIDYCINFMWNLECKNLVHRYIAQYQLCEDTLDAAEKLGDEDEEEMKILKQKIRKQCNKLAYKYKFKYMPVFEN